MMFAPSQDMEAHAVCKVIFTNNGPVTKVSDEDFVYLAGFNWFVDSKGYVRLSNGKKMHRIIANRMGIDLSNQIDHRDRDKLNNRRSNLRIATNSQNQANRGLRPHNSSGHTGVIWCSYKNKWRPYVSKDGKRHYSGRYDSIEDAIEARNTLAEKLFGKFACPT